MAHRDGEPCPECGLPWETTDAVLTARRKFAEDDRTRRLEAAEVRAGQAERDRDRHRRALTEACEEMRALLAELDRVINEPDGPEGRTVEFRDRWSR